MGLFKEEALERLEGEETRGERPSVLVVDDEPGNLIVLRSVLGRDHRLLEAHSGAEALEMLSRYEDIAMIVSDQRMPGMTGVEMLEQTREVAPDAVRIIVTGFADIDAVIDAVNRAHIYRFVVKPFDRRDFRLTVRRALEARAMDLELQRYYHSLEQMVEQRTRELVELTERLKQISITDPLTGLHNRRFLLDTIEADVATCRRRLEETDDLSAVPEDASLVFLLLDLDHFKKVNDTWGHDAGDRALEQMAEILRQQCRSSDILVRWGGEEFLIVHRFRGRDKAAILAERLRDSVAKHAFDLGHDATCACTCSIGFAPFPFVLDQPKGLSWQQVVSLADQALYLAKRGGRDAWIGLEPGGGVSSFQVEEALAISGETTFPLDLVRIESSLRDEQLARLVEVADE